MTLQDIFEELRFVWELLAAELLLLGAFAPKRRGAVPLAALGILAFSLLSMGRFLVAELRHILPELLFHGAVVGWYLCLAVLSVLFLRCCFSLGVSDMFYLCAAGYALQYGVYALVNQLLAWELWPELSRLIGPYAVTTLAAGAAVLILVSRLFARQLRLCGGRLFPDTGGYVSGCGGLLVLLVACTCLCQYSSSQEGGRITGACLGLLLCGLVLGMQYGALRALQASRVQGAVEQLNLASGRHYAMSKELVSRLSQISHVAVYTGNDALNTILTEKLLYCETHRIRLFCVVDGRRLDFIPDADLYAMLGGAVDNAVSCAEQFPEQGKRFVGLTIRAQDAYTCIRVSHYCEQLPELWDGLPGGDRRTSYGLHGIRVLAGKYGGYLCFSEQDHIFMLQIMLPAPQE